MTVAPARGVGTPAQWLGGHGLRSDLRTACDALFNRDDVKAELGIAPAWVAALPVVVGHPTGAAPPVPRHPAVITWR